MVWRISAGSFHRGKARPEDRQLAEPSGLSDGAQINVDIAVDNTAFLGRRWK